MALWGVQAIQTESAKGVLVVLEPDENVREALQTLLQGRGWVIEAANEAQELEDLLESLDIVAVISEASLPDCPAVEVLHACAQRQVPVIFTGHNLTAQEAVDLILQGGHDYLEKPFQQERLMDLLKHLPNRQNE